MSNSPQEHPNVSERYSRQQVIENWNQAKLRNTTCIIAGAGALGSVVAVNLAQAGVGKLIIIDMDTIEFSNLNRQLLFTEHDVGQLKVDITKQRLQAINSTVNIETYDSKLQTLPVHLFKPRNQHEKVIIVDALDNFEGRRWLNSISVNTNTPLVSGGMYGYLGNVQIIIPHELPCLECQPLIPERELQKACTPIGEVRKAEREEETIDVVDEVEEYFPALGTVSSIIGGIMAQEALKLGMGLDYLKDYLFVDSERNTFIRIPLAIKKDCIVCSEVFKLEGIPVNFELTETIVELKSRLALQFNLSVTDLDLIHNLKSLSDSSLTIETILGDMKKTTLYISASNITSPIKIVLEKKKKVKSKVIPNETLVESTKKKNTKKRKKKKKKKAKTTKKKTSSKTAKKATTKKAAKKRNKTKSKKK